MADVRERWRTERLPAITYDAVVERERTARVFGWAMWGTDARRLYREFARLGEEPAGTEILDVPCGGGVAFRGLRRGQDVRYVAGDISQVMLGRARGEAGRRGLTQVEFVETDVERLPFDDGSFDLCVSYNSLHCFPDPAAALAEMARVVRRGGSFRGTSVVAGSGIRQDAFIALNRRAGNFGEVGTLEELRAWLEGAGFADLEVSRDGAIAYVEGSRPGGDDAPGSAAGAEAG